MNMGLYRKDIEKEEAINPWFLSVADSIKNWKILDGVENKSPTKILMLTANPYNTTKTNLDKEHSKIAEKLQKQSDEFVLSVKRAVNRTEFKEFIEHTKPNFLHFSGHGQEEDEESGLEAGIIVQSDDKNDRELISAIQLNILFEYFKEQDIDIKLVILNACYSEAQAKAINEYVPFVIGTGREIDNSHAIGFSVGFYFKISETLDIEKAFKSGRTQAVLEGANKEDFVLFKDGQKLDL